ncbi:MAG: PAS domain-containing protein [Planctomycetes bacterium]|nr:PAS domain-containing protein [Planctomycetota bacterium]
MDDRASSNRHLQTLAPLSVNDAGDFLENGNQPMFCLSPLGRIVWANKAELALLGYPAEEYIGHHISEFHADTRKADDLMSTLAAGEEVREFNCQLRARDGALLHVAVNASGLWREGKLVHCRVFTHEIGRQRRMEIELRDRAGQLEQLLTQNEALLAQLSCLLDTAPVGIAFVDTQMRYVCLNAAMASLHGAPVEAHVGRMPHEVMRSGGEEAEERYRRVLKSGQPEISVQDSELWGRKTGQRLACSYYPVSSPEGDALGVGVVATDLTGHMNMLAALREAQDSLHKVINNAPLVLWVIDKDGKVLVSEGKALEALKLSPGQVVGQSAYDLFGHLPAIQNLRKALEGETVHFTANVDGPWFDVHISPTRDDNGVVTGAFVVGVDITQLKQAETHQRELEGAFTQVRRLEGLRVMASGIGHDLNNLLTAIAGNTRLALMRLPPTAVARYNIEQIDAAAKRASDLTREMLACAGGTKSELQPLDINEFVNSMAEVLDLSLGSKIGMRKDFAPMLPAIRGDVGQLGRVVMGLISNAADAIGGEMGTITLATGRLEATREYLSKCAGGEKLPAGEYVYLDVIDNGSGMDEATQARLFLPFFSTKRSGAGLSLAAALGRMRAHNGAIMVQSTPGKGSIFRLLFPATDAAVPEAPAPPPEVSVPWQAGQTVLVVDDDEAVRNVAKMILEEFKLTPLLAESGQRALEVLRENRDTISLVILDLTMPGMSGEETLQELRKIKPDIKVVISTGYTEREVGARLSNQRPAGFLPKPYGPAQMRDILIQALT